MIGEALRDLLPGAKVIYLERSSVPKGAAIKVVGCGTVSYISLPQEVYKKMQMFDIGFTMGGLESSREFRDTIEPFEFELVLPINIVNQLGTSQIYRVLSESKTLEYLPRT